MDRVIPKTLQGYSPKDLEQKGDLELYIWAFKDLWDHDQQRINILKDRYESRIKDQSELHLKLLWNTRTGE